MPEHGVLQVRVPWAEARSRFTLLMDRFVIDVLQQCANLGAAQRILRISCDEAWGVMVLIPAEAIACSGGR